jgi:hypothetical protein
VERRMMKGGWSEEKENEERMEWSRRRLGGG